MKRQMQRQGQTGPDGAPAPSQRRQPQQRATPSQRTKPVQFVREVRVELKKVAWPTRGEVVNYSIIVLIAVVLLTAYVAALDYGFGEVLLKLFER